MDEIEAEVKSSTKKRKTYTWEEKYINLPSDSPFNAGDKVLIRKKEEKRVEDR